MTLCIDDKHIDEIRKIPTREKFLKLFSELEHYNEDEQKQKIREMNGLVEEMEKEEFGSIFKADLFDKMDKMIEENNLTIENSILLLKHAGYYNVLKRIWICEFKYSSLNKRFEKIIIYEIEKKKGKKNEKLKIDICECYLLLNDDDTSNELASICVPCLLKAALKKEETVEVQKEVEMALLCLSCIDDRYFFWKEKYLKEITEIIKHQQKHRNLTKLAYQSAWQFLISRFYRDVSLDVSIVNEMNFKGEASRELEALTRNVNWKKKKEEMNKEEAKEEFALMRWLETSNIYFLNFKLENKEYVSLFRSIVRVFRAAKDNHKELCDQCIYSLRNAAGRELVKTDDLVKSGAADAVLEGIQRPTLNEGVSEKKKRKTEEEEVEEDEEEEGEERMKERKKKEKKEKETEKECDEDDEKKKMMMEKERKRRRRKEMRGRRGKKRKEEEEKRREGEEKEGEEKEEA
eukprot:MONOS_7127.1-p1 / transcript=MONOS_7127.1 / gene=MONOS_7127 / organism=Monocercomonoides_exilis_PA203 / gene_product=unspecified product / transcript_product=unspecified product / location=Mono_scaffold00237:26579-28371(-) / protein_length=462 / sequence_SO=supercontig / SO=protein_coding / is_pseudo=false